MSDAEVETLWRLGGVFVHAHGCGRTVRTVNDFGGPRPHCDYHPTRHGGPHGFLDWADMVHVPNTRKV